VVDLPNLLHPPDPSVPINRHRVRIHKVPEVEGQIKTSADKLPGKPKCSSSSHECKPASSDENVKLYKHLHEFLLPYNYITHP
jgi:hypothetical protein